MPRPFVGLASFNGVSLGPKSPVLFLQRVAPLVALLPLDGDSDETQHLPEQLLLANIRLQLRNDLAGVLLPPVGKESAVAPETGLRQVFIACQYQMLVVRSLDTITEKSASLSEAQIVEAVTVHLLENGRIADMDNLSGRSELAQVGDEWIPQLPSGVPECDADCGTARGFNQIGGLVSGCRKIHRANPLVDNSARCDSIKKLSTRPMMTWVVSLPTRRYIASACQCYALCLLTEGDLCCSPLRGPQLVLEASDGLLGRYVAVEAHESLRGAGERGLIPVSGV